MADFLQVADQRERITDWLRSLLHSLCGLNHKMLVEEEPEGGRAVPDARELVQMLHDTQVRSRAVALIYSTRLLQRLLCWSILLFTVAITSDRTSRGRNVFQPVLVSSWPDLAGRRLRAVGAPDSVHHRTVFRCSRHI